MKSIMESRTHVSDTACIFCRCEARLRLIGLKHVYIWLIKAAAVLVSFLVLQGCATIKTYDGPGLPKTKVAIIEIENPFFFSVSNTITTIFEVDGKPVGYLSSGKLELAAGIRRLKGYCSSIMGFEANRRMYFEPVTVTFYAKGGRVYVLREGRIVDKKTGKIMGDFKP